MLHVNNSFSGCVYALTIVSLDSFAKHSCNSQKHELSLTKIDESSFPYFLQINPYSSNFIFSECIIYNAKPWPHCAISGLISLQLVLEQMLML